MRERSPLGPFLPPLLEALLSGRHDLSLRDFATGQIDWAIQSGLGPACYRVAKNNPDNLASPSWPSIKAADLTARMIAAEHIDAMQEIIDASRAYVPYLTLLKGISIAEQYYPEPHLRPMRDIDFLVPEQSLASMETLLISLGYERKLAKEWEFYDTHHHLPPFFNRERGIWMEVHRRLLGAANRASRDGIFNLDHVKAQIRSSRFQGREVGRLSAEFQIIYLASHWAQDFKSTGGIVALMDLMILLRREETHLRWDVMLEWLQDSAAASYVYLLLSYIDRYRWVNLPRVFLERLFRIQRFFGTLSLATAHAIIDRYIMDGRRFGSLWNRRNLSVAWETLVLPVPSPCKFLLLPFNICMPWRCRIH